MPEPFDGLGWPVGLSSMEILWAWLEVRIEGEGRDDSIHFGADQARAAGANLCFLPWLCLTRGGLEPLVGRPSNPDRSLLMLNEATTIS